MSLQGENLSIRGWVDAKEAAHFSGNSLEFGSKSRLNGGEFQVMGEDVTCESHIEAKSLIFDVKNLSLGSIASFDVNGLLQVRAKDRFDVASGAFFKIENLFVESLEGIVGGNFQVKDTTQFTGFHNLSFDADASMDSGRIFIETQSLKLEGALKSRNILKLSASGGLHIYNSGKAESDDVLVVESNGHFLNQGNVSGKTGVFKVDSLTNENKIKLEENLQIETEGHFWNNGGVLKAKNASITSGSYGNVFGGNIEVEEDLTINSDWYALNCLSTTNANRITINTSLNMNLMGYLHGRSQLTTNSLIDLNLLGIHQSFRYTANSFYSVQAGLYIPSIPSWDELFPKDGHWYDSPIFSSLYSGVMAYAPSGVRSGVNLARSLTRLPSMYQQGQRIYNSSFSRKEDKRMRMSEFVQLLTDTKNLAVSTYNVASEIKKVSAEVKKVTWDSLSQESLDAIKNGFNSSLKNHNVKDLSRTIGSKVGGCIGEIGANARNAKDSFNEYGGFKGIACQLYDQLEGETYKEKAKGLTTRTLSPACDISWKAGKILVMPSYTQDSLFAHNAGFVFSGNVYRRNIWENSSGYTKADTVTLDTWYGRDTGHTVANRWTVNAKDYQFDGSADVGTCIWNMDSLHFGSESSVRANKLSIETGTFDGICDLKGKSIKVHAEKANFDKESLFKGTDVNVSFDKGTYAAKIVATAHASLHSKSDVDLEAGSEVKGEKSASVVSDTNVTIGEGASVTSQGQTYIKADRVTNHGEVTGGKQAIVIGEEEAHNFGTVKSTEVGGLVEVRGAKVHNGGNIKAVRGTAVLTTREQADQDSESPGELRGNATTSENSILEGDFTVVEGKKVDHSGQAFGMKEVAFIASDKINVHDTSRVEGPRVYFEARVINDVEDLLDGKGCYKGLKVGELLGVKTGEAVNLSRKHHTTFSLDLTGSHVELDRGASLESDKFISVTATDGSIINRAGKIRGGIFTNLEASQDVINDHYAHHFLGHIGDGKYSDQVKFDQGEVLGGSGKEYEVINPETGEKELINVGLRVMAGGKVINNGSRFASGASNIIEGEKGVYSKSASHEYVSKDAKYTKWLVSHHDKETDTNVQTADFDSINGRNIIMAPNGEIVFTGASLTSRLGNDFLARNDIILKDEITENTAVQRKSSLLALFGSKSKQTTEKSTPTTLFDIGRSRMVSTEGNVECKGVNILGLGSLLAKGKNVTFETSTLNHKYSDRSYGFSPSGVGVDFARALYNGDQAGKMLASQNSLLSSLDDWVNSSSGVEHAAHGFNTIQDAVNFGHSIRNGIQNECLQGELLQRLGLSDGILGTVPLKFSAQKTSGAYQTQGSGMIMKDSVTIIADKDVKLGNGIFVNVNEDMNVSAKRFIQEGGQHESSHRSESVEVSSDILGNTSVNHRQEKTQATDVVMQNLNVRGNIHVDAEVWEQKNATATAITGSGKVDVLNSTSTVSKHSAMSDSQGASSSGFVSYSQDREKTEVVKEKSGVTIQNPDSENGMKVGTTVLTGALVNGFSPDKIVKNDVQETTKSRGFSVSGSLKSFIPQSQSEDQGTNKEKAPLSKPLFEAVNLSKSSRNFKAVHHSVVSDKGPGESSLVESDGYEVLQDTHSNIKLKVPILNKKEWDSATKSPKETQSVNTTLHTSEKTEETELDDVEAEQLKDFTDSNSAVEETPGDMLSEGENIPVDLRFSETSDENEQSEINFAGDTLDLQNIDLTLSTPNGSVPVSIDINNRNEEAINLFQEDHMPNERNSSGTGYFSDGDDESGYINTFSRNVGEYIQDCEGLSTVAQRLATFNESYVGQAIGSVDNYLIVPISHTAGMLTANGLRTSGLCSKVVAQDLGQTTELLVGWFSPGAISKIASVSKFGKLSRGMSALALETRAVSIAKKTHLSKLGRRGKQAQLRRMAKDPKIGRNIKGEIIHAINQKKRGKRNTIPVPKGHELAHKRGLEAQKGFSYKYTDLKTKSGHRLQHKKDLGGRLNKTPSCYPNHNWEGHFEGKCGVDHYKNYLSSLEKKK